MDADYYRLLFDYGWWARDRLFDAATKLDDAAWLRPNGFTYGSIGAILLHTQQAEARLAMRFQRLPVTGAMLSAADAPSLGGLQTMWQEEEAKLRTWLGSLQDADLAGIIPTRDGEIELWKSMAHLTYHGMQHRSEAAEALTMAGASPGDIDLLIYLSQRG
jgi:uncharacterized damage-inducible protein DinB